jgi:hypothetical protein
MNAIRMVLRAVGSLWFAAVLLVLLLVAMACATVYESTSGAEQALTAFYRSGWFEALLYLVGVNVIAAVLLRYPFSRKQAGFVVTHLAIVLTLVGALITEQFGVDGQVGIAEGQRVEQFNVPSQDALTITNSGNQSRASIALDSAAFRGRRPAEHPSSATLALGDVQLSVQRYLPDTLWSWEVLASDDPSLLPAIEVSLSGSQGNDANWVFAERRPVTIGPTSVSFRLASSAAELAGLLGQGAASQPASADVVRVVCKGETFEIPLEQCQDGPAPVGDTGYTVHVLRYLPHATVLPDKGLVSASDQPVNPAIEVEIAGPSGRETRIAFAKYPGFSHGEKQLAEVDLTFVHGGEQTSTAPLEIIGGPDGQMYARFEHAGAPSEPRQLQIGTPVETPWPGYELTILRRFTHARVEWSLKPHVPVRADPEPGLLVEIRTPAETEEMWVQKHQPRPLLIDDESYELSYSARQLPLGFGLTLDSFRIGTYAGTQRPRSFESQITTEQPVTGRIQHHVISMNHPAKVGGYTLYQSSYSQPAQGPAISYLSVSRDPGEPVVFAGYIGLMVGMLMVFWTRIVERRAKTAASRPACVSARGTGPDDGRGESGG